MLTSSVARTSPDSPGTRCIFFLALLHLFSYKILLVGIGGIGSFRAKNQPRDEVVPPSPFRSMVLWRWFLANANPCRNRFGQQLRRSLIGDYVAHYIAYDDLKASLKTPAGEGGESRRGPPSTWTSEDERRFVALLEAELDKVFRFQCDQSAEIVRRIRAAERAVTELLGKIDGGPDRLPTEENFIFLEAELSDIIADVHDLAKFTQLNYTGFQKIIKKHDVSTGPAGPVRLELRVDIVGSRVIETYVLASQTRLRHSTEGQTVLSG